MDSYQIKVFEWCPIAGSKTLSQIFKCIPTLRSKELNSDSSPSLRDPYSMVFRAQKMPNLTENNRDRSEADQFEIRESLVLKDR